MCSGEDIQNCASLNYPLNIEDDCNMKKEILKPFTHLTTVPGKRIRQNLLNVLGHWLTVPEEKLAGLDEIINLIHNGSLLIDDIQDRSVLRRGTPTAHLVYGVPRAVISATWVNASIIENIYNICGPEMAVMYSKDLVEMFAGQGMDVYWRDSGICPTEAEYLQMVYKKTGIVFALIARIMSTSHEEKLASIEKLLITMGIYFQINDDYQNLSNKIYYDAKGFCEDLSEGKYSFPIVYAINNFPTEGKIIKQILDERTFDIEKKKYCLSLLEKCGSFEYTRKKITDLKLIIQEEMAKLDPNPLFQDYIETAMLSCM